MAGRRHRTRRGMDEGLQAWPRRLEPFFKDLSRAAQVAFADLVEAGCQPDMLAFQFHEATQVDEYAKDHDRLIADLEELDKLGNQAMEAVKRFANRRRQFDEYLLARRLRAVEGDPVTLNSECSPSILKI